MSDSAYNEFKTILMKNGQTRGKKPYLETNQL